MKFWQHGNPYLRDRDVYKMVHKVNVFPSAHMWYEYKCHEHGETDGGFVMKEAFERKWHKIGMPYYNVYPSVIPMLTKLDVDKIQANQLCPPNGIKDIVVQLPKVKHNLGSVRSMFLSFFPGADNEDWDGIFQYDSVSIGLVTDEINEDGFPTYHMFYFRLNSKTIGQFLSENFRCNKEESYVMGQAVRLLCTICLIGDSPELIQPEVLNADEHKLTGQHCIEALVAKARRRGKYGFTIGKDIEVMPHYRRPHLALVWYGKGKKKSKIIPRKGSIVHRAAVEKIPTGYAADEKPVIDMETARELLRCQEKAVLDEIAECKPEHKSELEAELKEVRRKLDKFNNES
jgi:hypothetical protein